MVSEDKKYRDWVVQNSTHCALCGHYLSVRNGRVLGEADHILSQKLHPHLSKDKQNYQASHGRFSKCEVCGEACNQVKGSNEHTRPKRSRDW